MSFRKKKRKLKKLMFPAYRKYIVHTPQTLRKITLMQ